MFPHYNSLRYGNGLKLHLFGENYFTNLIHASDISENILSDYGVYTNADPTNISSYNLRFSQLFAGLICVASKTAVDLKWKGNLIW